VLKFFIDKGVLATYTDILNQTVLYYASREGKANCIDLLVKLGTVFYYNPYSGCNVNHRDQYGQTPLYYAAREGHTELAQKLIAYGSDVNNEDANGQTALFYCSREGHKDMCELLLKHGALANKQDKKRQTALHWAKKNGKHEVKAIAIKHGIGNGIIDEAWGHAAQRTNSGEGEIVEKKWREKKAARQELVQEVCPHPL